MRSITSLIDEIVRYGNRRLDGAKPSDIATLLSELLYHCYAQEWMRDDMKYQDPPEPDLSGIRKNVSLNFPGFGSYESLSGRGSGARKETRNAAEDLSSLIAALLKIKWYFEKTTKKNGVQRLKEAFRGGMGILIAELIAFLVYSEKVIRDGTA